MAKKYIDAENLTKDLERLCDIVCQYSKEQRDVMCVSCPLGDAFELLDNQPAADVTEVVRCKDCKYRDDDDFCEGRGWPMQLVPDDGFCDKGERRE